MNKWLSVAFILSVSCSSAPKQSYQISKTASFITTYEQIGNSLRLEGRLDEAIVYYLKAISQAVMVSNADREAALRLKLAQLYLKQNLLDKYQNEVNDVEQLIEFRKIKREQELRFIKAKYDFFTGNKESGNQKINALIDYFKEDNERKIYYQSVYAFHNTEVTSKDMKAKVDLLNVLYKEEELKNIEILSYTFYVYIECLVRENNGSTISEISRALTFYNRIQHVSRVEDMYRLAIVHLKKGNNKEMLTFYQNQLIKHKHALQN